MGFWAAALVVAKWIFKGKGFWAWLTRTILTTAAMFGLGKLLARSGGAKAEDIYVQGQGYGSPVKRVWGTMRIAGNLIWVWSKGIVCNKRKSHPNNYYARFAIQICEGPIVGVKKIWFGPKLVFDDDTFKGTISRDTDKISLEIWNCQTLDNRDIGIVRIYLGTETQTADSAMESDLGAGNVPAYRGYAYAVFEGSSLGANLDVFGGQIPPVTFEVVSGGTAAVGSWTTVADLPAVRSDPAVVNWNGHIYVIGGNDGAAKIDTALVYQASDSWKDLKAGSSAPTWTARDGIAATAASFGILLYGGDSGAAVLSTAFMLSENGIRAATQSGTGPGARKDAACIVTQETTPILILSGGHDGSAARQDCYRGTLSKNGIRWQKKNATCGHGTRYGHSFVEFSGTIYCIGGTCVSDATKSNACYSVNSTSLAFTELVADLTNGDCAAGSVWGAAVCNGVIVAFVSDAVLGKIRIYQSSDGATWTEIAFPVTIGDYDERPGFVTFEGELYLIGGTIAAAAVATVRRYHGWSSVTSSTTLTVADVVGDLLTEAGLSSWEYDVSALTDVIHGYALADVRTIRESIEDLQAAYLFDLVQNDWRLIAVPRGGAVAATLDENYLAAHQAGSECPDRIVYTRIRETELPTELRFGYVDLDRTYEPNVQTAKRILDHTTTTADISVPIAMDADDAATAATKLLYSAWANRGEVELTASFRYLKLIPTDVISVTVDSITYKIRIEKMDFSTDGLLKVAGAVEDVDIYTVTATGTAAQTPEAKIFYPPHLVLIDTIHQAALAEPWAGIWAVATPAGDLEGWRGAWLWISRDGGTTYQKIGEFSKPCAIGTALNAIAKPTDFCVWDDARYLDVQLINDFVPESPGDQAVMNGMSGIWRAGDENLAASTVTSLGSNQYRLSRLLRGIRGSEHAADDHVIGECVVCLDSAIFVPLEMSDYNATLLFKISAPGADHLDDIPPVAHAYEGENYLIPSPVDIQAERDSVGNIAIKWKRRNRIGCDLVDGQDIPLGEDGEVYEIDVYNGGSVVRTIRAEAAGGGPLAMPEITYTADEQITDFTVVQSSLDVKVYQIGKVGRGREAAATV